MVTSFLLSQTLAAFAFALGIAAFQFKTRQTVLFYWCGSALVNACHFLILGLPEPATLAALTGIRFLTAAFTTSRKVMSVFFVLVVIGFWMTFQQPLSLLALVATLLGTYGSFRPSDREVRVFLMGCALIWMVYNFLVWSPVAAMMEASFFMSNVLGFVRFYSSGRFEKFRIQERKE